MYKASLTSRSETSLFRSPPRDSARAFFIKVICLVFITVPFLSAKAAPPDGTPNDNAASSTHWASIKPVIGEADGFGETPALIKLGSGAPVVSPGGDGATKLIPVRYFHRSSKAQGSPSGRDPVIQNTAPTLNTPSPSINFPGMSNIDGYIPPDTVGAIGPSNYVQAVNVRVQVFNRFTGATQTLAAPISSLSPCSGPAACALPRTTVTP